MLVKGKISAIYAEEKKLSVILPEYNNLTTNPLKVYGNSDMNNFAVNDFVVVAVFNNDFNDAIVVSGVSDLGKLQSEGHKKTLFYIDEEGNVSTLKLGKGLVIVDGVLCLTDKLTASILGEAELGNTILG